MNQEDIFKEIEIKTTDSIHKLGKVQFLPPADEYSQVGVDGITFDFNSSFRIKFPVNMKVYHLQVEDMKTHEKLLDTKVFPGSTFQGEYFYLIHYRIRIFYKDTLIFEHIFNPSGKYVLFQIGGDTLGDTIAWFSYVEAFQKKYSCTPVVWMKKKFSDLFQDQYPSIIFVNNCTDLKKYSYYATFYPALYDENYKVNCKVNGRTLPLNHIMSYILDLPTVEYTPRLNLSHERIIKDKYVTISSQSTALCKYWNNPSGWDEVIDFLHSRGYRVLDIDKDKVRGMNYTYNHIPFGSEDYTGNKPLQERVDIIKDADFFIGLSSGLSWLAWCCKVPVIMIGGFALPYSEFYTPYRVINYNACTGCYNDPKYKLLEDYFWCPKISNEEDKFECTKRITGEMVIDKIKEIIGE